jgi:hypothetical protein
MTAQLRVFVSSVQTELEGDAPKYKRFGKVTGRIQDSTGNRPIPRENRPIESTDNRPTAPPNRPIAGASTRPRPDHAKRKPPKGRGSR